MADDDVTDNATTPSSDDGSDASEAVELLVTGRERRKTAGNRYDRETVLEDAASEEEDEVALLFAAAENEEDEEFKSEASDADEMSSSDDDDQGPNAGGEELEGEKELQVQAKKERAKKRKADLALTSTQGLRKKVKLDPTRQTQIVAKKPSKKKERVTWIPDAGTSAARSSLRKQTIAHREETLARLKESEAISTKMRVLKEKRDKEKAKDAPKAMTQADRLAEADRVERKNAKSLNRWETMEKKRVEEQAARLAALKNRKLSGPFVTLWSGKAYYRGPRPSQVWKEPIDDPAEPKKRGRKPKGYHEHMAALRAASESVPVSAQQSPKPLQLPGTPQAIQQPSNQPAQHQALSATSQGPNNFFLSGIHEYAIMQTDLTGTTTTNPASPNPTTNDGGSQNGEQKTPDSQPPEPTNPNIFSKQEERPDTASSTISVRIPSALGYPQQQIFATQTPTVPPVANQPFMHQMAQSLIQSFPPAPAQGFQPLIQPVEEGYTTKNLVILNKFDDLPDTARQAYNLFYNSRRSNKPVKHNPELCPITTMPAKYRDPKTGIGYANMWAYKMLQEAREHKFTWSSMLGCYVGREGVAVARGVSEGFLGR